MKKILSIMLCVALVLTLTPAVFAANGSYQNMSDTVWTFSESENVADYGNVGNTAFDSSVTIVTDNSLTGEDDDVLKIDRPKGGSGSNIYISFVHHNEVVVASEFKVAFDFNVSNTNTLFKFVIKPSASVADLNAVEWYGGNIKFLGNSSVGKYEANKWYHVELLFNIPKGYGQLKMTDYATSAVSEYNTIAKTGALSGWNSTCRIALGLQDNIGSVLVDNYYQNKVDVPAAFLGSDDFSNGIDGWTAGNMTGTTILARQVEVAGNQMLEINANGGVEKNTSMYKNITSIAGADENTNYHFKFKLGGNAERGTIGASVQTNDNGTNKEFFLARVIDMDLKLLGGLTNQDNIVDIPSTFGVPTETNLYEFEAVYNPSTSTMVVVVTNDEGKQFAVSSKLWSGIPNKFAFRHHISKAGSTAVGHYDDFATDILDNNGPDFVSSEVLSGYADAASLDETAVFTYDRTISQAALAEATVTLNNEILSSDAYTITSKGNKVLVTLKDLALDTEYTVGVSGIKDIIGNASADTAEVTFTTSDVSITATKPQLNGTVLSTNVTSYYAQGKAISLIIAVYNASETELEAVKEATVIAKSRDGEVLSFDFAQILGDTTGKKIKGFVWSGFDSMTPYAEAYK